MIIQQKDGSLYCHKCKRNCDDICYRSCKGYRGACVTCKHWLDESGFCDDCTYTESKWEDAYEH